MSAPASAAAPAAQPAYMVGAALGITAVALALGTFMQVLDTTIANVSIPTIAGNLGTSTEQGTWIITAFAVSNAISVPLTGWLMQRFGVVRTFCGHAIGREFHGDLSIPHYDEPRAVTVFEPGMTFTIEPMITMGSWRERIWPDGWTAVTADGLRTAQYEHTLVVTDDGAEVLTPSESLPASL